jgi:phosphatidylglycerol lysyltransferase
MISGHAQLGFLKRAHPLRAALTASTLAPAALLAFCTAASVAYAFGFMKPAADWLDTVLPIDPNDANPTLAILSAIGLGALTAGMLRAKAIAWWLTIVTFGVALVAQPDLVTHPLVVVTVGIVFVVLVADRGRYEVETGFGWRRLIAGLLFVALVILALETVLIIVATDDWPKAFASAGDLTWAFASALGLSDDAGQRILRLTSRDALLGLLILIARLPVVLAAIGILSRVAEPPPDPSTRSKARAIADRYGSGALLPFQLGEDKYVFSPANSEGLVVYGMAGRTEVILGDLIGPEESAASAFTEFVARSRRLDRVPVVYQASTTGRTQLVEAGFRTFKVGEEAIVDLVTFDLAGSRRANLRHTIARCKRDGVTLRWFPDGLPAEEVALAADLEVVDAAWRKHAGPPMGFTIGHFDRSTLTSQPSCVAVDATGRAIGFTTFRPTGMDAGWVLDLMRRSPDGPPGVVESCIAEAAMGFRAAGARSLSLGFAPLAGLDGSDGPAEERLLTRGGRLVQRWYDVRGLAFFKNKFDPYWIPRYGAIRRRRDLVAFVIGLLWVHLAGSLHLPGRQRTREAAAI